MPIRPVSGKIHSQEINDNFSYLESTFRNVDKGSPKGAYATISDLQNAHPDGDDGIYVITGEGNWYYWDGSTWALGGAYQSTGLSNNSVSPIKTDFFEAGKNLFNKEAATTDARLDGNNGQTFTATGVSTSDFIQVTPGEKYTRNKTDAYSFYDSSKTYITGGVSSSTTVTFTVPANAAYIRMSLNTNDLDIFQFEKGEETTAYERYNGKTREDIRVAKGSLDFFGENPKGKNLYNPSTANPGKWINGTTGLLENSFNSNYDTTDYIPVISGKTVFISASSHSYTLFRAYAFYDENKRFISGGDSSAGYGDSIGIPHGTYYVRISYPFDASNLQIEYNQITSYEPFEGYQAIEKKDVSPILFNDIRAETLGNEYAGLKSAWNGDSITEGYNAGGEPYVDKVARGLGMNVANFAIGGSTIAVKEADPTNRDPIVSRYQNMDNDADLVIIAGGTNDWQYSWTPVGTMADRTDFTFYGALHNLCLGLMEKYIGKPILFMTPIKRSQDPLLTPESTNNNGLTLAEYGNIIKEVCGYYGIPVLDMYNESMINPHITSHKTAHIPDGSHPNQAGHEIMARRVQGFLKQLR